MAATFTPSTAHPCEKSFAWSVLLMSALGHYQTLEGGSGMSALSAEADMLIFDIDVR